jgi:hypothetical protein
MFEDKVFQTMVFSRHMQEASHDYENFGLKWSFKYSKIPWYLANHGIQNRVFYMPAKHLWKKYHGILQYHGCLKTLKIFGFQTPP